jgi:hypothetical protein
MLCSKRQREDISTSKTISDLEEEVIFLLSEKLKKDQSPTKKQRSYTRTYVVKRKRRRRWGNIMILNPGDFTNDQFFLGKEQFLSFDTTKTFSLGLNPKEITLPNGINFSRWFIAHMVSTSKFKDENTSELLRNHVSPTSSLVTQNYWRYRLEMLNPESTYSLTPQEEENLLSSYAIYTSGDEAILNAMFPTQAPFPSCSDFQMFDRVKFIKRVIYPMYKGSIQKVGWIEIFRKNLRARTDVFITSDGFPFLKILKDKYPVLYYAHRDLFTGFFIVDETSVKRALQSLQSIESICVVILAAIILMVDKEWFGSD